MGALLALIPSRDWLWAAALVALGLLGLHVHHKLLAEGIAEQQAADDKEKATLVAQTAKQTAELQAKATMAEQAYDKEHQAILDQPSLPAVRLCGNPHPGSVVVSKTGAANQGNAASGAATGDLQPMPAGSNSVGSEQNPDISDLLSLLAQHADDYSAELREYQARE
jgi:hypothetical protein